ncbi:1-acyl-sn-glycerol-3-phosphate acyltransferase [bacterium]|nr:1-acyl-sn-glycerol-3-phosphate acyltransferase [bacterium]
MTFLYSFAVSLCWVYAKLVCRVEVTGLENIPSESGFLLTANHLSYFDPFLVAGKINRCVHFLAMEELFKNPVTAFFMRKWNAIPVKRKSYDSTALKQAVKLLKDNKVIGVFPEGAIANSNNNNEYKTGVAMLALHSKKAILPVNIEGTRNLYRPWKRGHIRIEFKKSFIIGGNDMKIETSGGKKAMRKRLVQVIERRIKDNG